MEHNLLPKGTKVPDHIAMILDGNRRWARSRGLAPWEGHMAGYQAIRKIAQAVRDCGVHTFTIWSFSTENWDRPKEEIDQIFKLLKNGLKEFAKDAKKDRVRLVHLGRKDRFPADLVARINSLERETRHFDRHVLNLALDYGGQDEILRAVKKIIAGKVPAEKLDSKLFATYLDTAGQPYPNPDLFIRTSGELRTSGLMPWQLTYSELYFEPCHLPDFTPQMLRKAILDYSCRRRRFGGNDTAAHLTFRPEVTAKLELAWWRLANVPPHAKFLDFVASYLKEQYGLSKDLAKKAGKHLMAALIYGDTREYEAAKKPLKKFYRLIKKHLKLAFEPEIVASLKVNFWQEADGKNTEALEEIAASLTAEEYRLSAFQAKKAAHLRVLAEQERRLARDGGGEVHWQRARGYLQKYYLALKERVA